MAGFFITFFVRERGRFACKRPAIAGTDFPSIFDHLRRHVFINVCKNVLLTHTRVTILIRS